MFEARKGMTVVSVSADGLTTAYRKNNKLYHVARGASPGYYPAGSRTASYEGGTDRRHSRLAIEMVRERRSTGKMNRHVKPGPQSWSN